MSIIFKRSKILATLGPATNSYEAIEQLMHEGVNGFRFNFSHGSHEERLEQIGWIRSASEKSGKPVAILQDLQGPKIRLGELEHNINVTSGDELVLGYGEPHAGTTLPVQYNLAEKVKVNEAIYLFDGKIRATVMSIDSETAIRIRIENDGVLMSRKGINLPDTDFAGDIITEKDTQDIAFGANQDIDFVSLSFVQSLGDIVQLRQMLSEQGSKAKVIAKIETKASIEPDTLEAIVRESDGVMVARGDLAVEAGAEVVPIVQRKIIALCRKYGKLSIVATQMMASMVDSPEPTRAEVSDVAQAVIQGADVVMLSDETANGKYPFETVAAMKKVILYTQDNVPVAPMHDQLKQGSIELDAIAASTVELAHQMDVAAIIAKTKTGATTESIAAYRPHLPIISITSDPKTAQYLALRYGTRSYIREDGEGVAYNLAKELKENGYFAQDNTESPLRVAIVSGRVPGQPGTTDTIRLRVIQ